METSSQQISFTSLPFQELSLFELCDILKLRQEVFIVEQACPYQDIDDLDKFAHHVLGKNPSGELLSYARLLPENTSYPDYISIGRIVTSPKTRKVGLGRKLMEFSIRKSYQIYGYQDIKIGAQYYLLSFYQSFGFEPYGNPYLEDGIKHIQMIKNCVVIQ